MQVIDETNCSDSDALPVRRRLHHVPPVCVSQYATHAEYFITVCVDRAHYGIPPGDAGRRGPLANEATAGIILDAVEFRRTNGEWYPCLALVMPDHVHFILYVTQAMDVSIKMVVRGLWQGVKKIGRDYSMSISPNTIR